MESEIVKGADWMAVVDYVVNHGSYDEVLTHEWLIETFGLHKPEYGTQKQFDAFNFDYMQGVEQVRRYLLEEQNLAIQNIRGQGYRIVPPNDQVDAARNQAQNEIHRGIKKYAWHLQNIRYAELSASERQKRDDHLAKLAQLEGLAKRSLASK